MTLPTPGVTTNWGGQLNTHINTVGQGVSVAGYGTVGDGVTDDTAAIHAARDAAAASGVDLHFPAGTYRTAGLTASRAGQTWRLDAGATIKPNAPTQAAITVTASRVKVTGGTIDMTGDTLYAGVFVGAGLSDVAVDGVRIIEGGNGVRVKDATGATTSRVSVRNCRIENPATHCVYLNWEAVDCEVVSNTMTTVSVSSNGVLAANGSTGLRVQGNTIGPIGETGVEVILASHGAMVQGNVITNTGAFGVSVDKSDHCTVSNNRIDTTASFNVELADSNRSVVAGNILIDSATDAIRLNSNAGFTTDHTAITGNEIYSPVGSAVAAQGVSAGSNYVAVTGNVIRDAGAVAIQPFTGNLGWTISGNEIHWTVASFGSINLNGGSHTVVGNSITHDPAIASSAGTAIRIPSSSNLVAGNHVTGNDKVANGIEVTSTWQNNTIVGNRVFGTTSNLILISSTATNNTLIGNHAQRSIGGAVTPGGARGSHFDGPTGRTWHMGPQQFLTSADIGFYGTAPIAKRTGTPADATDLATAITLVNALKAHLVTYGLIS